jgi:hypothetical protein
MDRKMSKPRQKPSLYYALLVEIIGFSILVYALLQIMRGSVRSEWLIIASVTVLTGTFALKIPSFSSKISLAETLTFANLILFGPAAGAVTAAIDGLTSFIRTKQPSKRMRYILFNTAGLTLSVWVSGQVFFQILRRPPLYEGTGAATGETIFAAIIMAMVHYSINSICVAAMIFLEKGDSFFRIWREAYLWSSLIYLTSGLSAALITRNLVTNVPTALGIIMPLITLMYLTSRTYLYRVKQVRLFEG